MDELDHQPVSDLEDNTRQEMREAVESSGYFDSDEQRRRLLAQPLGALRREDIDSLATAFGQARLTRHTDKSLSDLAQEDKDAVLAHLEAKDWFVDQSRVQSLDLQSLDDLGPELGAGVVTSLREAQVEQLRQKRLSELGAEDRRNVRDGMRRLGEGLGASHMRPLMRKPLADLEEQVREEIRRDIGGQAIASWGEKTFGNLEAAQQEVLVDFFGRQIMGRIERRVLLHTISRLWIDYLTDIEDLRRGIGLEAYAQRDPLVEYKRQAFELFERLGENIRRSTVRTLFRQSPEPLTNLS
jgi:hypothetical protein